MVAFVTAQARGRDSGAQVSQEEAHTWTFRGGKVIAFEWSPSQTMEAGGEPLLPFDVLDAHGYTNYRFYSKVGTFEREMNGIDQQLLVELNEACLRNESDELYFDVVAT